MNTLTSMYTLGVRDFIKGAVVAVLGGVLVVIQQSFTTHTGIDWSLVEQVAEGAFVGYLIKNYFTDSTGKLFGGI